MPATLTWVDWDVWTDWSDWIGPTGTDIPGAVDLQAVSTLTAAAGVRSGQGACTLTAVSTLTARAVTGAIIRPHHGRVVPPRTTHPRPSIGRITCGSGVIERPDTGVTDRPGPLD